MFLICKLLNINRLNKPDLFKLLLLLLMAGRSANAQTAYYKPIGLGVGYGVTVAVAGEETLTSSNAFNASLSYYFTPFTSVSLEGQAGYLTSGDALHDQYAKQFINDFVSGMVHVDVQAGEFFDYSRNQFLNGLKNIYAGIGIGFIANRITDIQTVDPSPESTAPFTYLPTSTNFLLPLRVGYEFKIFDRHDEPNVRFDINYSFNTAFGAGLDGYTSVYTKSYIKFYNYVSVGIKFNVGSSRPYRKQIYYSSF